MEMALESADSEAAEVVAAVCIVLAETKDHLNAAHVLNIYDHD